MSSSGTIHVALTGGLFNALVQSYCGLKGTLVLAKAARFPRLSVVKVAAPRYHGMGVVVLDEQCPPEQLAIRIENDNVWFYDACLCEPITDRSKWPSWIRKHVARTRRRERSPLPLVRTSGVVSKDQALPNTFFRNETILPEAKPNER